jgi:hypothetical protein
MADAVSGSLLHFLWYKGRENPMVAGSVRAGLDRPGIVPDGFVYSSGPVFWLE